MKQEVMIPGSLVAEVEHGKISRFTFTPDAADAGYFGPEIVVWEGDDIDSETFFDMVADKLSQASDNRSAAATVFWEC